METEEKIILLAESLHKLILIELGYGFLHADKFKALREIKEELVPLIKGA